MALSPKSSLVQIRVSPELLARFQACCDAREITVSEALRRFMHGEASAYEAHLAKRAAEAARSVSAPIPSPESFQLEKTPQKPVKSVSDGRNRAQRRADAKRGL